MDRCRCNNRRLARFLKTLSARHADFRTRVSGKLQKDRPCVFVKGGNLRSRPFQIFLQLERITLNGEIEVADGEPADDVTNRAARQIEIHARGAGNVLAIGLNDLKILIKTFPAVIGSRGAY